jgi:hypothetical protein
MVDAMAPILPNFAYVLSLSAAVLICSSTMSTSKPAH